MPLILPGICTIILDSAAVLTVTLASRHTDASSLDAGGRICCDAPANVPDMWAGERTRHEGCWTYLPRGSDGRI